VENKHTTADCGSAGHVD